MKKSKEQVVTRIHRNDTNGWFPYPENPDDKISGEPQVKINMFRSTGDLTPVHRAMLLSIEPSEFRYRFIGDESWIVLEGHVTITLEDGEVVDMKKDDLVSIKGGRNSVWVVHEHFVKFVVVTSAENQLA